MDDYSDYYMDTDGYENFYTYAYKDAHAGCDSYGHASA